MHHQWPLRGNYNSIARIQALVSFSKSQGEGLLNNHRICLHIVTLVVLSRNNQ